MDEYLSEDILDEGYLRVFSPFHRLQMALGCCRFDARDQFVTAPTTVQKIYSVVLILTIFVFFVAFGAFYKSKFPKHSGIVFLCAFSFGLHYVSYAVSLVHARFLNVERNRKFLLKMQEVDRKMNIHNIKLFNDCLFRINLANVAVLCVIAATIQIFALWDNFYAGVTSFGMLLTQTSSTLECLYISNLILYFILRVRFINAIMMNYLDAKKMTKRGRHKPFPDKTCMRHVAYDHHFRNTDTDDYLKEIFHLFYNFQKLYRFQMFIFCTKFVCNSFVAVQYSIVVLQNNEQLGPERIAMPLVIFRDFILLSVVCVRLEILYKEIEETKYLAVTVLSVVFDDAVGVRGRAKRSARRAGGGGPRFGVYGMWRLGAAALLRTLALVTSLTLTLLQFALL